MGKASRTRRHFEHMKKKRAIKAARAAKYAGMAASGDNSKRKRLKEGRRAKLNVFRTRVRTKRMAVWNGAWDAGLTWKQVHNTISAKKLFKPAPTVEHQLSMRPMGTNKAALREYRGARKRFKRAIRKLERITNGVEALKAGLASLDAAQ